ncbi:hypothetical protein ACFXB3_40055 [Streptomyces sp. NPDC059447]|uniref:hypothetical protein n=1 Tax=Streptomyces sp. NPDC059447 TaxID=3346834 RepID=UPI0036B09D2B
MTPTTHDGERPVERRLRQALDARAAEVTVRTLRPAEPPGPHTAVPRLRRRLAFALAGLGVAAAALAGYLVLAPEDAPVRPVPPAAPPELGSPSPSPSPSASPSSPGTSTPSPGGTRTPKSPSASPSSPLTPGASVSRSVTPSAFPTPGGTSVSPSVPRSPSPS